MMNSHRERVFRCPHCALEMTVQEILGPAQVTCPACFHRIRLTPSEDPVEPEAGDLSEFNRLPEPIIIRTEVARPATDKRVIKRAARKFFKQQHGESIRKTRVRRLQIAAVAIVGLVFAGTAAALSFRGLSQVSDAAWADIIPGRENPPELIQDFERICLQFRETCQQVDDTHARDRAIPRINGLASRLRGIPKRVEKLTPLTSTHRPMVNADSMSELKRNRDLALTSLRQARSKRLLYSNDYFQSLQRFADAMDGALDSVSENWGIGGQAMLSVDTPKL